MDTIKKKELIDSAMKALVSMKEKREKAAKEAEAIFKVFYNPKK